MRVPNSILLLSLLFITVILFGLYYQNSHYTLQAKDRSISDLKQELYNASTKAKNINQDLYACTHDLIIAQSNPANTSHTYRPAELGIFTPDIQDNVLQNIFTFKGTEYETYFKGGILAQNEQFYISSNVYPNSEIIRMAGPVTPPAEFKEKNLNFWSVTKTISFAGLKKYKNTKGITFYRTASSIPDFTYSTLLHNPGTKQRFLIRVSWQSSGEPVIPDLNLIDKALREVMDNIELADGVLEGAG